MKYKLKNVNGRVKSMLKTGKDYSVNTISISAAQHIIDNGKITESDREGYPICVDGLWYFEGEPVVERRPREKAAHHETKV
nr:MAG TPA: hypothetical protein [Caudoviricetes sp.]